jgi:hypothetical protein
MKLRIAESGTVRSLIWKSKNLSKIGSITSTENNFKAFCTKRITDNHDLALSGRHTDFDLESRIGKYWWLDLSV